MLLPCSTRVNQTPNQEMINSVPVLILVVLTFVAVATWVIIHYGLEDSKPHKRPVLLVSGTVSFLIGSVLLCMAIDGIEKGEIENFHRIHPGGFVRKDDPIAFWRAEAFVLIEGILYGSGGIFNFTKALNIGKKSLDEIMTDLDAEVERNDRDSGIWTCPNCGAESDETRESCWRCGTGKRIRQP